MDKAPFARGFLTYLKTRLEIAMSFNAVVDAIRRFTGTQSEVRKAVDSIGRQAGIRIGHADNDGGLLIVSWKGHEYHAFVISADHVTVRISVNSLIRFPPRRLPIDVCRAVEEMNESMQNCSYGEYHFDNRSGFAARTWMPVMDLSAGSFLHVFSNLVESVQTLDHLLCKYGYVR